jgi:hypothetical protein
MYGAVIHHAGVVRLPVRGEQTSLSVAAGILCRRPILPVRSGLRGGTAQAAIEQQEYCPKAEFRGEHCGWEGKRTVPTRQRKEVLRRTSSRVLSWVTTVGFGLVAVGLIISLTYIPDGGPASGVAACFFTIAFCRRLFGSRIVLGSSGVTVVNPLITYQVPYTAIGEIRGGNGGTLNLVTWTGDEIYSTAFGGSITDYVVGSTERAADRIEKRVKTRRTSTQQGLVEKKFTTSWIADFCAVGGVVFVILAGALGI